MNTALPLKDGAVFSFVGKTTYKFEDAKEGELLSYVFKFKNTGSRPLIISDYKVACSCTKAIYSKAPVLPGKEGEIEIKFDTNGKYGYQDRVVSIYSNGLNDPVKLRIKVFVYKE